MKPEPSLLTFDPVYQPYPWGGERLRELYGRRAPPGKLSESWEISTRSEGPSVINRGPWAGRTLAELVRAHPQEVVGGTASNGADFPLLFKIIDARERLSLQVHPDDAAAARGLGEAKAEMWVVLDAEPGARIWAGWREPVTPAGVKAASETGAFEALLQSFPARRGDAFFIPGGRVHALDAGAVIYEVQQNSNTTYRLHDWGRLGTDGKPRPTHLSQALAVLHWSADDGARCTPRVLPCPPPNVIRELVPDRHFTVCALELRGEWEDPSPRTGFIAYFVARGAARFACPSDELTAPAGTSLLIPAALGRVQILPAEAGTELLRVTAAV